MYLWIGCKLPEIFQQEIRDRCLKFNEDIGLDTVAFLLPQHISLKISFETAQPDAVLDDLTEFLSSQRPFSVCLCSAEQAGKILWLPVAENETLRHLHDALDQRLERCFGVPRHEFDKAFLFHSTLFIDEDLQKVSAMYRKLLEYPVDRELPVDTFLLGTSETGKAGDYRIVREIRL